MSCNRFFFILRCLRFDDRNTREETNSLDKLDAVRDLYEVLNASFQNNYSLSENVTIDEQLPAFRGRFSGLVYMPSKPNKYGIKHIAVVDSASYYLHKFEIYAGTQPNGPFKIPNDTVSNSYGAKHFRIWQIRHDGQLVHECYLSKKTSRRPSFEHGWNITQKQA